MYYFYIFYPRMTVKKSPIDAVRGMMIWTPVLNLCSCGGEVGVLTERGALNGRSPEKGPKLLTREAEQ